LNSLLAPASSNAPPSTQKISLAYTSVDIEPGGITLHGSLSLRPWPIPHVEYQQIPQNNTNPITGIFNQGPDYSALNSWIPGGTIGQFEWSVFGQEQQYPFDIDARRFVLLHS